MHERTSDSVVFCACVVCDFIEFSPLQLISSVSDFAAGRVATRTATCFSSMSVIAMSGPREGVSAAKFANGVPSSECFRSFTSIGISPKNGNPISCAIT